MSNSTSIWSFAAGETKRLFLSSIFVTVFLIFRSQRERELENLKKTLESETHSFETQLQQMRQKHNSSNEQFQDEIDSLRRVSRTVDASWYGGDIPLEVQHDTCRS